MSEPHPEGEPAQPDGPPQFSKEPPAGGGAAPPPYGQPPQGGYPPAGQQGYGQELSPADQRMWAMLAHLGGILFSALAPLIVYLVQKDRGQYVKEQSLEALNFQITVLIGYVVSAVLVVVVIGIFTWIIIGVAALVLAIVAALAANKGENYRYPLTLRLVS